MGIDKLNKYLQKKVPNAYTKKSVYELENQKIAIDASILMYKYMNCALKIVVNKTNILEQDIDRHELIRVWINVMIKSLSIWLNYKCLPIMVFDGKPDYIKKDTLMERAEKRKARKLKIEELTCQIRADPLSSCHLIKDLKHELINYIDIHHEDKTLFKNVLESIGIPCLMATSEAEQLCAMLCIEGYCMGAYSLDSDLLCYGCPLMITKFSDEYYMDENGVQDLQIECISIDIVLKELKMTRDMFIDFCIMCGCDYNTSIKGVGPAKILKYIIKHQSIDHIPIDITCFNHIACRNAFKLVPARSLVAEGDIDDLTMKPYDVTYALYTKHHAYNIKLYYKNLQ